MHEEMSEATAPGPATGDDTLGGAGSVQPQGKRVRRRDLLNLLNFINFRGGTILASFRHPSNGEHITVSVCPLPCLDEVLECSWLHPGRVARAMAAYACEDFVISDGSTHIVVKAEVLRQDDSAIVFRIPECGYEKSSRKIDRHASVGIQARLVQEGMAFEGRLEDFNALSFRIKIDGEAAGSLPWLNASAPVSAFFSRDGVLLYSGECRVIRAVGSRKSRELVLSPSLSNIRRFKPKKYRSNRFVLSPAPTMRFIHPLTGDRVQLSVRDISGAGLGVEERVESSLLLPGLIIPELSVEIANRLVFSCRAQVLYRNLVNADHGGESVRCGIVLLDMAVVDQARLSAILHQSADDRLIVCGNIDMDELWRLFFESGFIYPSKYKSILDHKEEFKRTYEKLYLESPSIARHFLVQDRGRLLGHMSMLRFYSNSWIIHHHSASRDGSGMAGVAVLDEIGRYGNEFFLHPSAHIDYLVCYYRRENRFPSRVFGNVVKDIADPKGSSIDAFAYFHLGPVDEGGEGPFQLFPARAEEMVQLRRWYEKGSGGLLLEAMDLIEDGLDDEALSAEFVSQGFKRERHIFCLKQDGRLLAILVLTLSDLGLNLSNLTNCLHVLVIDRERLRAETLFSGARSLLRQYGAEDIPVLAHPPEYLDARDIRYEKTYLLWALAMERADAYFDSLHNTFRRTPSDGNGHDGG